MGDIELCNIEGVKDYIYKNGDDWYLHKEIGTNTPDINSGTLRDLTNVDYFQITKPSDYMGSGNYTYYPMKATYGEVIKQPTGGQDSLDGVGKVCVGTTRTQIWLGFANGTTIETMKSTLSGLKLYYALTTPYEEKIEDQDLINSLELISSFSVTGSNLTISVTGDLNPTISIDYVDFNPYHQYNKYVYIIATGGYEEIN